MRKGTSESASEAQTGITIARERIIVVSRFDVRELRRRGRETGKSLRRRLLPTVTAWNRALLSTLNVSDTNDSGTGSLSAADPQANSDGGSDTIGF